MSSDNFTPPPAPCEGFLCYYEAGDNYLSSSVVWKLIIAVSIISAICFLIALIFCITNCRRKTRTGQAKDRQPVLKSIPPPPPVRHSPASEKVAPFAVPEEI